jgi:hypothetical protein
MNPTTHTIPLPSTSTPPTSYKAGVKTGSREPNFTFNGLRFATEAEAQAYGNDLMWRWLAVTDLQVFGSPDAVTATFLDGKLTFLPKPHEMQTPAPELKEAA